MEADLRKIYDAADTDVNGSVSKTELLKALHVDNQLVTLLRLPKHCTEVRKSRAMQRYFEHADSNNDDELSWEEFYTSVRELHKEMEQEDGEEPENEDGVTLTKAQKKCQKKKQAKLRKDEEITTAAEPPSIAVASPVLAQKAQDVDDEIALLMGQLEDVSALTPPKQEKQQTGHDHAVPQVQDDAHKMALAAKDEEDKAVLECVQREADAMLSDKLSAQIVLQQVEHENLMARKEEEHSKAVEEAHSKAVAAYELELSGVGEVHAAALQAKEEELTVAAKAKDEAHANAHANALLLVREAIQLKEEDHQKKLAAAKEASKAAHTEAMLAKEAESVQRMEELSMAVQEAMASKDAANTAALKALDEQHAKELEGIPKGWGSASVSAASDDSGKAAGHVSAAEHAAALESLKAAHAQAMVAKETESVQRMEELSMAVQEAMASKDAVNAKALEMLQGEHQEAIRKDAETFQILTRAAARKNKSQKIYNPADEDDNGNASDGSDDEDREEKEEQEHKEGGGKTKSSSSSPAMGIAALASSITSAFGWAGNKTTIRSPSPPTWDKMRAPSPTEVVKPKAAVAAQASSPEAGEMGGASLAGEQAEEQGDGTPAASLVDPAKHAELEPAKRAELEQARALMAAMTQRITNPHTSSGGQLQLPKVAGWLSGDGHVQQNLDELATELRLGMEERVRMEDERGTMQITVSALEGQMLCDPNVSKTVALQVLTESRNRAQGVAKQAQEMFDAEVDRHSEVLARLQAQLLELSSQKGPMEHITGFWGRNWQGQTQPAE
jgi:hypothetical protein